MKLVDVRKWFGYPVKINPDMVCGVHVEEHQFRIQTIGGITYGSKSHPTERDAENAMNECIKRLEGEI